MTISHESSANICVEPTVRDSGPVRRFKYCSFITLGASHRRGSRTWFFDQYVNYGEMNKILQRKASYKWWFHLTGRIHDTAEEAIDWYWKKKWKGRIGASTSSVSNPVDDGWRTGPVAALG